MKRVFTWPLLGLALLGLIGTVITSIAQDTAGVAAREAAEENYRKLAGTVQQLADNQALQQQRLDGLERSLNELRGEIAKANNNTATQESLRRLAEQIQEVDKARVTENRRIQETLDDLHRLIKGVASAPPPSRPAPAPAPSTSAGPTSNEEGFEYVVQKDDTLSGIVSAYRTQGIKVTQKAVREANPSVNCDRLRVNQKIFIPKPKK